MVTKNKNGVSKNVEKLATEWPKFVEGLKKPATHWSGVWTNKFVEAARSSPYVMGHIDAVAYPLLIILAAASWVV